MLYLIFGALQSTICKESAELENNMPVAKVSSKGQITLPVESRRAIGIKPGDRVLVEAEGTQVVVKPIGDFFELKGFLGKALPRRQERAKAMLAAASRSARKV